MSPYTHPEGQHARTGIQGPQRRSWGGMRGGHGALPGALIRPANPAAHSDSCHQSRRPLPAQFGQHLGKLWRKWLGRRNRSGKPPSWEQFDGMLQAFPLIPAKIVHSYT